MTFALKTARSLMTVDTKIAAIGRPRSNSKVHVVGAHSPQSAKNLKFGLSVTSSPSPLAHFSQQKPVEVPLRPSVNLWKAPLPIRPFQVLPLPLVEGECTSLGKLHTPPPAYEEIDSTYSSYSQETHGSLLLSVPSTHSRYSPSLMSALGATLPCHLSSILSTTDFEYRPQERSLTVTIFNSFHQKTSRGHESLQLSAIQSISELHINVIPAAARCPSHHMVAQCSFIFWFLGWIQAHKKTPLEAVIVSLPETFEASVLSSLNFQCLGIKTLDLNFRVLSWIGAVPLLRLLLRSTKKLQELHIVSELSVIDALVLLQELSGSRIHTLSIGAIVPCKSVLVPSYYSAGQINLPTISLHHLDSLKITTVVDPSLLFDGILLPNLCKIELDVADARSDVFDHIYDLQLDWENILYVDVVHDVGMEREDNLIGILHHISPGASIAMNGELVG